MADHHFSELKARLLKGGVAPKHVRRTIAELHDHVGDLMAELISQGFNEIDAKREAQARIGSDDAIARDILAKPELKSWGARWPWAVYGVGPILSFIGFAGASIFLVFGVAATFGYMDSDVRHLTPEWFMSGVDAFFMGVCYLMPLLLLVIVSRYAASRHSPSGWPELGLVVLCICAGAFDVAVTWPGALEAPGYLHVGFALAPPFPDQTETLVRVATNLAVLFLLMRFFRQRQMQS